ncbi:hypothetical protein [Dactylosporangium sp. CA-233914]|uniref:hypothetical protein n=1 Tax=Dactylosporangium sp. CA-233914 TaxID=3239934 RepID=UPI003D944219
MEQDLRTLLTSARNDAPPPRLSVDDITAAGRHLVRRRRRLALLSSVGGGAVAAVAAVTAALVLLGSPRVVTPAVDPSALPAASPVPTAFVEAEPFVATYRAYQAGGYIVSDPDLVTAAYQQSSIDAGFVVDPQPSASPASRAGNGNGNPSLPAHPAATAEPPMTTVPGLLRGGTLVVYRPDAFDPAMFLKASEKIQLRSGAVGLLLAASGNGAQPTMSPNDRALYQKLGRMVPALAWQYTGDAWAAIYWSAWETVPSRDELLSIAEGLTPAAPRPFQVGLQATHIPSGYHLLSASSGSDLRTGKLVVSAVRLSPETPSLPLYQPYDFDELPAVTLALGRTDAGAKMAGVLDCTATTLCTRFLRDGTTYVSAEAGGGVKNGVVTQLSQITLGIRAQDPADSRDWPPATKAFP